MKVLLIGSGGREHAIFWKLSQSPLLKTLHVFPGNGGFPEESIVSEPGLTLNRIPSLVAFIKKSGYDFVFVGPEQPLVDGLVDELDGICPAFGPTHWAARLEGSKNFSKEFMANYGIPTARSASFTKSAEAIEYLKTRPLPIVIKADGLAAGKGVTVAQTFDEAKHAVVEALDDNRFGDSGRLVLVEDFLRGREASVFAICDGERALPFIAARDHKRAFDNDEGPNTGGMGAYAPVDFVNEAVMERVQTRILDRVIAGMNRRGTPYRGLLYAGLMIEEGEPSVVEFNVRFGDPETQPLMLLLDEDLLDLAYKAAVGRLPNGPLKFRAGSALVVVLAASGYPDEYVKNTPLKNIDSPRQDIFVFHAGTRRENGVYYSSGGRILGVTSAGIDLPEARKKAYGAIRELEVPGTFYRSDIAGSI